MHPRIMQIAFATLVLLMCRAGADQGRATVVRDSRAGSGNPAVEAGGYHLPHGPPPPVPYSLIGAIATESNSCVADAAWSRRWFSSFRFRSQFSPFTRRFSPFVHPFSPFVWHRHAGFRSTSGVRPPSLPPFR
jgi:hypothetical protein